LRCTQETLENCEDYYRSFDEVGNIFDDHKPKCKSCREHFEGYHCSLEYCRAF
jgi:hypothetical protein